MLGDSKSPPAVTPGSLGKLFLASFVALFFELVIIRYLSTEIRIFAYLQNLPLIASFFGIGLGMLLGRAPKSLLRVFPLVAAALFLLITFAAPLRLTHLPFPEADYVVWGGPKDLDIAPLLFAARYFGVVLGVIALVVAFFVVLGGIVGEHLTRLRPLPGYGTNLLGSLAGIAAFTLLAFWALPPVVWVSVGFGLAVPFFWKQRLALVSFLVIVAATAWPQPDTYWSPYYRVGLYRFSPPEGWHQPHAYHVDVNHDYHQRMVDLSTEFLARYPTLEPNRSSLPTYELPYRLVANPGEVLIVGAGSGNDVAAALRHGATHVDAVEIDPIIVRLGRRYHPERPYYSPRVTVHIDDARAFFKKAKKQYDLIVFGYLDSHTLLSSYSSLRLDNYVYTLESFREARRLLKPDGTLVLAFNSGLGFVTDRLFATLARAFDVSPRAYFTGYDYSGVVLIQGRARETATLKDFPEVSRQLEARRLSSLVTTDRWPFLYLAKRTVPASILTILIPFLCGAAVLLRHAVNLSRVASRGNLHFFFLGAGFLLLQTKGVIELSLLFGSTWVVNAVVIGAFLAMGLLANTLVMFRPVPRWLAYAILFVLLGAGMVFPYSVLDGLPTAAKVLAGGGIVALPVFFSGLIFSRSFRDVAQPSQALGVNLLGAVVGGTLENTVMLAGTPMLGALAIFLYVCSAFLALKAGAAGPVPEPATA